MNKKTEQIFLINPPIGQSSVTTQLTLETPVPSQINLENVEDLSTVCRTCATTTEFLVPIFSGAGLQNNLADKIRKHLPIQVQEQDELPGSVCYQCANKLLAWHEMVACCQQADAALKTRLQQIQSKTQRIVNVEDVLRNGQELVTVSKLEGRVKEKKETKPCKPCRRSSETADECFTLNELHFSDHPETHSNGSIDISDDDDEPLSTLANTKSLDFYNNFYKALINFRDHFVNKHDTQKYSDSSESSESEMIADSDNLNVESFDDLTQSNMRKDRMDEETRMELNQVQTKINGKVYYTCKICGKNLSSSHTYVFHKRIHTGERPCVCHVCGKQFRAPNGLQRHLTETHEKVRRHSCRFCPKNFANSQNLKQHMRIHTGERPYVCAQCGKRFTQSGSLHVHLKTHSEQFPFQCAECGAKFRIRSGLSRHRLKHTRERPHVCVHCGKGFRQKNELNSHSLTHSDTKPFNCIICGAAFRLRRALLNHTKRLHEAEQIREPTHAMTSRGPNNMLIYTQIGQYQSAVVASLRNCQYCRAPVPPKAYKDHIITYHAGLVFHCDECNSYVDKRIFIYHMSAHSLEYTREAKIKQQRDRDENQNAKAEPQPVSEVKIKQLPAVDAEPTENTTSLETPVASANDAQNEFSDHSDAEYGFGPLPESVFEAIEDSQEVNALNKSPSTRPDNPLTEITESNNKTEPKDSNKKKSRTCPQCGKVYTVSSSYFYHVKHYHHALKTHGCTVCGRKFATQSMVNAHMQTHSGKFDYECKHCKKRFRSKPSLYIHEQSHIGVKKHSCTLCDISFRWRTHLERHMKRHSAERKHICSKCKRGFDVHCDLLRHMRTHVTGKFICDICDTTFKQKRYLKVHMTKHVEK